ncbi:hypothetical protein KPB2_5499 [Klebsiella pneumoniae Kb677]|nr:hypothetical protein KPB2_5499 [Klebsiella pneumoniae Kb677]
MFRLQYHNELSTPGLVIVVTGVNRVSSVISDVVAYGAIAVPPRSTSTYIDTSVYRGFRAASANGPIFKTVGGGTGLIGIGRMS